MTEATSSRRPRDLLSGGLWRALGRLLGRKRRRLLLQPPLAALIAVLDTVVMLATVRLLLLLVDDRDAVPLPITGTEVSFRAVASAAAVCAVIVALLRVVEARFTARLAADAVHGARDLVLRTYFEAEWEHHRDGRLGRLQQLLGTNAQQAALPVIAFCSATLAGLTLLLYAIIVVVSAPLVAGCFVLLAATVSLLFKPARAKTKVRARRTAQEVGDLQVTATSYAQLNRELHAFGAHAAAAEHLARMNAKTRAAYVSVRERTRAIPALFQQFLLMGVLGMIVLARITDVDVADFGAAAILAVRALSYVQLLNTATQQIAESRPFIDELLGAVSEQRSGRRVSGSTPLDVVDHLTLRDVTYAYGDRTVLQGIDLGIARGTWLGIIGPSGGGKTTLANIIVGLSRPTAGDYLVNGVVSTDYRTEDWVQHFAIVSQEPLLLRATLAQNIDFHRSATRSEIVAAAELAAVRQEIEALPLGFDTDVGDGQANLSGGQRQRIALARALLCKPSVLVLDEATSALDAHNEKLLEDALGSLPSGTTVIVVSHRPTLLDRCHQVIRMEDGRITARGDARSVHLQTTARGPARERSRLRAAGR